MSRPRRTLASLGSSATMARMHTVSSGRVRAMGLYTLRSSYRRGKKLTRSQRVRIVQLFQKPAPFFSPFMPTLVPSPAITALHA